MSFKSYEVPASPLEAGDLTQADVQDWQSLGVEPGCVLVHPGHSIQYVEPGKGTATIFPDGTLVRVVEGPDGIPIVSVSLAS
jgi:hypothetical protein